MMLLILMFNLQAEEPKVVYKETTQIDFEAVDVEGQIKKPHGVLLTEQQRARFNPLVHLRLEWSQEMTDSLNDIQ